MKDVMRGDMRDGIQLWDPHSLSVNHFTSKYKKVQMCPNAQNDQSQYWEIFEAQKSAHAAHISAAYLGYNCGWMKPKNDFSHWLIFDGHAKGLGLGVKS